MKRNILPVIIVVLTGLVLAGSLVAGQRPLLGLDLQGGAEVLLRPSQTPENLELASDPLNLDRAAQIIRKRVDAIGVAEPDVTVQGTDVVVQLPGIEDQQRIIELVGQTGVLGFRPVLIDLATFNPEAAPNIPGVNGGPGSAEFAAGQLTPQEDVKDDQSAVLAGPGGFYLVGPTIFTGSALEGAQAVNLGPGAWSVSITFLDGADGIGKLNEAALLCYTATQACPTGQMAVVLDSSVESTNGFETPTFDQRTVSLSRGGGGFSQEEAVDSALVLDFGALPLAFDDPAEAGLIRSVSATLGRDSLNAGLIAGAIGLLLVALYMFWYYRLLGFAAMLSLAVSATWLWVIVAFLSSTQGLALTLAGVVGLIVAVGVSLDSNVVYFENIKEYVNNGSPFTPATDSSFPSAFQTVFYANMATLIGAVILYFLTAGSVKGFALMLGIASILDLLATWFFMRPLVQLLAGRFGDKPSRFGIRSQRDSSEDSRDGELAEVMA